MRIFIFNILLLFLITAASVHGQEKLIKLKGQVDAYSGLNFSDPVQWQTGARFIPSVSIGKEWKNNLKFDSEISINSYLDYHFTGWKNDMDGSGIKPYRLWLRLSSKRFEIRAGLDVLKDGDGTEFQIEEINFNTTIPDYIFSKASLKK